ncbi:hypothetical protein IH992_08030, partial [Candidatus Poribacteria bacterium]|nr:hypothetical protein [Candidatus Poribacteria bacterium]
MHIAEKKIKSVMRTGLIIIGIVILLSLLPEIVLRSFFPQKQEKIQKNDLPLLQKESRILGYVNRPNAHVIYEGPEFSAEYKINKDGLRDESIHPNPKRSNLIRILLLGDSFTFGHGNAYNEIWSVVFEHKLLEAGHYVDVVKAGVNGHDTKNEVLYLEQLFSKYDPDIVVLTFL